MCTGPRTSGSAGWWRVEHEFALRRGQVGCGDRLSEEGRAGAVASRNRDSELGGPNRKFVIDGGDGAGVMLGGKEDAAVGHLETGRRPQLPQAPSSADGQVERTHLEAGQKILEEVRPSGALGSDVDLPEYDARAERLGSMGREQVGASA